MGVRARLVLVVVVAAGVVAAGAWPALVRPAEAGQRVVTYDVTSRGDVRTELSVFRGLVASTLGDTRGWSLGGALEFVAVAGSGDLHVVLASPREMDRAAPVCSEQFSCQVGDDVLINDERFQRAVPHWPLSLHDYRHYVVNHEVGHWLGLGHARCPADGQPAPVMQQQSKSLEGCRATVWPLRAERLAVARRFGVRPALQWTRPAVVRPDGNDLLWIATDDVSSPRTLRSFRWGRPTKDDVPVTGDWNGDGIVTAGVARPDGVHWRWLLTDSVDSPRLHHDLRWGRPTKGDLPVVGDWDGDGRTTPAVVRPDGDDLRWLLNDRTTSPALSGSTAWGRPTKDDQPVVGDWDRDGRDTPGVVRPGEQSLRWLLTDSTGSPRLSHDLAWGRPGDAPVTGDWDGDGDDTPGVVQGQGADLVWQLTDDLSDPAESHRFTWGRPTKDDRPVAGRWAL